MLDRHTQKKKKNCTAQRAGCDPIARPPRPPITRNNNSQKVIRCPGDGDWATGNAKQDAPYRAAICSIWLIPDLEPNRRLRTATRQVICTPKGWVAAATKSSYDEPDRTSTKRKLLNHPLTRGEVVGVAQALGRNRSLRVIAPLQAILEKLRTFRLIITAKCRPAPARNLTNVPDSSIVKWYTALSHAILSYYRCCDNFHKVRSIVDYHVRWSAIFTLATKHKSSASKIIYKYSRDLIIASGDNERDTIARLPAKRDLAKVGRRFLVDIERGRVEKILKTPPRAF